MSDTPGGQLQGLRVLALGSLIAGPFCTRQLADMSLSEPDLATLSESGVIGLEAGPASPR